MTGFGPRGSVTLQHCQGENFETNVPREICVTRGVSCQEVTPRRITFSFRTPAETAAKPDHAYSGCGNARAASLALVHYGLSSSEDRATAG